MRLESLVYGAIMGVAFAFVFWWLSGRPRVLKPPSLSGVLTVVVALVVPQVAEAIGLGYTTGVLLLLAGVAIVFAWRRLRPQPG